MKAFYNAQIFSDGKLLDGFLTVHENGKIAQIGSKAQFASLTLPKGIEQIDCQQRLLLPGCVDAHVHFRDLEQDYKETLETGSQAALCGGVTTVLTMPNTKPPLSQPEIIQKYRNLPRKLYCNIGIIAGVAEGFKITQVPDLEKIGAFGIKIYPGSRSADCPLDWDTHWMDTVNLPFPPENIDIAQLTSRILPLPKYWGELFEAAKQGQFPILFHPEFPFPSDQLDAIYSKALVSAKKQTNIPHPELVAHDKSHNIAENEWVLIRMISGFLIAARKQNLALPHIHFCHVSNPESVRWIRQMQINGYPVSCETTPHHLCLNYAMQFQKAAYGKVLVPLRSPQVQEALWEEMQQEMIDSIGTDHAPHSAEEKDASFPQAPSGFPGIEIALPLLLTHMNRYRLALDKIIRFYAENPARIFHLHGKGSLYPGWDADLVLVEQCSPYPYDVSTSHSKARWSPYHGMELNMRVMQVYLKGQLAFDADRKLLNAHGEWLKKKRCIEG